METLRASGGCEWDREQTHFSLKPYMIEEAYEVVDAIEEDNPQHLKEELGDVLLQVVFHAQIASENGEFTLEESIELLNEKLVRRHPHVFGKTSTGYSYLQWEEIKAKEKERESAQRNSMADTLPHRPKKASRVGEFNQALPALLMARRVQENASTVGFDWKHAKDAIYKIEEEKQEIESLLSNEPGIGHTNSKELQDEIGDLLFSVVNVSRLLKIDPELALKKATQKFIRRFRVMEELLEADGLVLENQSLQILDTFWERVKRDEL